MALAGKFGWTEPVFDSHAGQLGTGHGARSKALSTCLGIPLLREREFEELIMVGSLRSKRCMGRTEADRWITSEPKSSMPKRKTTPEAKDKNSFK